MPRISIAIPAYNSAAYLPACLGSIIEQDFADWEAIVVVDGSPDDSAEVARRVAGDDARIRVVERSENRGIHRTRMEGGSLAQGTYVFFLDADDALHEGCLSKIDEALRSEEDADVLHVGINVIDMGVGEEERSVFEEFINRPCETLEGREIVDAAYNPDCGYAQDWRFTQRVYKTDLVKRALGFIVDERLGRNEDGYEYFVTACLAHKQVTRNDIVALDYYYGRGLNSSAKLSDERFLATAAEFSACLDAIDAFADTFDEFDVAPCVRGAHEKAIELLFNDFRNRTEISHASKLAVGLADVLGADTVARELWRIARDCAYQLYVDGGEIDPENELFSYVGAAKAAESVSDGQSSRSAEMRDQALTHLANLRLLHPAIRFREKPEADVRIFVTTHKVVDIPDGDVFIPVQVGPKATRFGWAFQDDDGDNIAPLNPMYCELTTQYWAWKNVEADYYGFCHYRRYFDFSVTEHEENDYGEVMADYVDKAAAAEYGLDDETVRSLVPAYDVITTGFHALHSFPERYKSPYDHYARAPYLKIADLELLARIVRETSPEFAEDVDAYLEGAESCFCNIFIMRKDIFDEYSGWLFAILERFCSERDMSMYSKEGLRTPGHLAERLLNIYVMHLKRTREDLRFGELQCVHFNHAEPGSEEKPLAEAGERTIIPVALASDNNYVPMLTTTIDSMLRNADPEPIYDIVILNKDISERNQAIMRRHFSQFENARLRFVNVTELMYRYDLATSNEHISVETYYRFLIQRVLPFYDKVLYLDSDLIIEGDVAKLYATELGDNLIGAVIDIDYLGNLNMNDGTRMTYTREVLGLKNPYGYFQAGVLVMNTKAMREEIPFETWLETALKGGYIYDDQDILNAKCQGRVVYLDGRWNVMTDCGDRIKNVFSFAPASVLDSFMAARKDPLVVHYAGAEKPWKMTWCDESVRYWGYARKTPFYETLLAMLSSGGTNATARPHKHERAISEKNPVRMVLDPLMPVGSRRRDLVKAVVRKIRGRE